MGPSKNSSVLHEHTSVSSDFFRDFSVLPDGALNHFFTASLSNGVFRDFSVLHEHTSVLKIGFLFRRLT